MSTPCSAATTRSTSAALTRGSPAPRRLSRSVAAPIAAGWSAASPVALRSAHGSSLDRRETLCRWRSQNVVRLWGARRLRTSARCGERVGRSLLSLRRGGAVCLGVWACLLVCVSVPVLQGAKRASAVTSERVCGSFTYTFAVMWRHAHSFWARCGFEYRGLEDSRQGRFFWNAPFPNG